MREAQRRLITKVCIQSRELRSITSDNSIKIELN